MALEDEFADILKKALRGTGTSVTSLARTIAIPADALHAWTAGTDRPTDEQARAVAAALHLDPGNFADAAAERWHPDPIALPDVRHHPQHPHPSNGYVFFVDGGRRAALVDPAGVPANLLRVLRDGPYHLEYILVTHKHADHCDATAEIAAAFPHATIVKHRADAPALGELAGRARPTKDGAELPFGDGVAVRMLHTPGHTDGSSSFVFRSTVFTGDTLFAGSIGGAYGDASTYADILKSVRTRLFTLPDETVVMPGHGPPTRIGWERAHNPFFPNESA